MQKVRKDASPMPYAEEWRRTQPDYIVFIPAPDGQPRWNSKDFSVLSEQLIVIPTAKENLLAFWTSHGPELKFKRIFISRSKNVGKTWSKPQVLDGSASSTACWAVPTVTASGRIYCVYSKWIGIGDRGPGWSGIMRCRYSDDQGQTWSSKTDLPFRRTSIDNPNPEAPPSWITWRSPERDRLGRILIPFTRWASPHSRVPNSSVPIKEVYSQCEIMCLENLDHDPSPKNIEISWLPKEDAVTVPNEDNPRASFAQEPSIVLLPDDRLFMAMRTNRGTIWYTISEDDGATWRKPEAMRYSDDGEKVLHPTSPAPIYRLNNGKLLLLYNHNDGFVFGAETRWDVRNRRPAYLALGEFRPKARQPIWWSSPQKFIDNDGIGMGPPGAERLEAATYTSLTELKGKRVLWYPDRKHFLLGKIIPDELLAGMVVPR